MSIPHIPQDLQHDVCVVVETKYGPIRGGRTYNGAAVFLVRYQIRWTPEQMRPKGIASHGTDRCLWALRVPNLTAQQKEVAVAWLDAIDNEFKTLEREGKPMRPLNQVLTLREDHTIACQDDRRWDQLKILPGEADA